MSADRRRLLISALSNWAAFAAHIATAFFLAPLLVRSLGDGPYGVWSVVESILAYCLLLDMGIAACVVRDVARCRASGDTAELNRTVSSCLAVFVAVAAALLLAALLAAWALAGRLGGELADPMASTLFVAVCGANMAACLPLSIFPAVLDGLDRFTTKNTIRVGFLLARVALIVLVVKSGHGLLGLAIVHAVTNVAEHLALALAAWWHWPALRLSPAHVNRETLARVRTYSGSALLAMLAGRVSYQTDSLVIGAFWPAALITHFGLAHRLVEFSKALVRSATMALTPAISGAEAAGDLQSVRSLFCQATRAALYLVVPVNLGLYFFGGPFLELWLGRGYAVHCYPTLAVLAATLSLTVAQSVAARVLYGVGRIKLFARLSAAEAACNLVISLSLVVPLGVVGVALGTALPNLVFQTAVIVMVCRYLGVGPAEYAARCLSGPLLAGVALAVWWAWPGRPEPTAWAEMFAAGGAGLLVFGLWAAVLELGDAPRRARVLAALGRKVPAAWGRRRVA